MHLYTEKETFSNVPSGIFMDTGDCKSCTLLCISLTVPCLAYEVYSYTYNAVLNIYRQPVICIYIDYILT